MLQVQINAEWHRDEDNYPYYDLFIDGEQHLLAEVCEEELHLMLNIPYFSPYYRNSFNFVVSFFDEDEIQIPDIGFFYITTNYDAVIEFYRKRPRLVTSLEDNDEGIPESFEYYAGNIIAELVYYRRALPKSLQNFLKQDNTIRQIHLPVLG